MEIVEELFRKMVVENSRKTMDQKEYSKKYNELVGIFKKAQDELNEIEEKQQENKVRKGSYTKGYYILLQGWNRN